MSEENGDHDEYDKIVRDTQAEFSDARAKRKAALFVAVTAACAIGATAKNEVLPGQRRNPLRTHSVPDSVTSGGSGTAFSQPEVPLCIVQKQPSYPTCDVGCASGPAGTESHKTGSDDADSNKPHSGQGKSLAW